MGMWSWKLILKLILKNNTQENFEKEELQEGTTLQILKHL